MLITDPCKYLKAVLYFYVGKRKAANSCRFFKSGSYLPLTGYLSGSAAEALAQTGKNLPFFFKTGIYLPARGRDAGLL